MAISKEIMLKIANDRATLSQPISVYKNDKGLDIYLTIQGLIYSFSDVNEMYYSASIVSPNKEKIKIPIEKMIDEKIKFRITTDLTDKIGVYSVHFHLHDDITGTNKITIPTVTFEVKEPLMQE